MLIVCPSCASGYSIDDEKIGPTGRNVRCASCRTDFFVTLADDRTAELEASALAQKIRAETVQAETVQAKTVQAETQGATDTEPGLRTTLPPDNVPFNTLNATPGEEQPAEFAITDNEGKAARLDSEEPAQPDPVKDTPASEALPDAGEPTAVPPPPVTGWKRFIPRLSRARAKGMRPKAKGARRGQPMPGRASSKARASAKGGKHDKGLLRRLAGPSALGLTGFALIAGLVLQREAVVRHVPSSAPVYAALGMAVNVNGLVFQNIASTAFREGEARFLLVEGMVRNVRGEAAAVPLIEVSVRGEDGRTLYSWTAEPPRASLRAGEALHFRTRLATPPEAGRAVAVRFADEARSASAPR